LLALGSLLQIVMALAMVFSGAMMQSQIRSGGIPGATAAAPLPGWMPIYMYALGAVFVALAVWGILTTVGLFRLRRWARYSILVICGCLALFGLVSCLMILLLMFVPLPMAANMDASQAQSAQSFVKIMFGAMAFFYFLVGALGVFWLVYFNLKTVREAF